MNGDFMKNRLLVLLPTRNRGVKTRECLQAWVENSKNSDLVLCVDDDDVDLPLYQVLSEEFNVKLRVGPRLRMCPTLNASVEDFINDYDHYAFIGDDHRFRTPDWDLSAMEALDTKTNGWGIWYGNDLLKGQELPTAAVMGGNLVRHLGYMSLPGLTHLYLDDFWKMLGENINALIYDNDVIIEHMHFTAGKSEQDQMYAEVNDPKMFHKDSVIFHEWRLNKMPSQVLEINKARGLV